MVSDIFCAIILTIKSDFIMVIKEHYSTSVRVLGNLHFGVDDALFQCQFYMLLFLSHKKA